MNGLTDILGLFLKPDLWQATLAAGTLLLLPALGIVLSAFLFGALHAGGSVMQADAGVSGNLVLVLQALILFSIAANFLRSIKFRLPGLGRAPDSPADVAPTAGPAGEEPNPALVDSQNTA